MTCAKALESQSILLDLAISSFRQTNYEIHEDRLNLIVAVCDSFTREGGRATTQKKARPANSVSDLKCMVKVHG